MAGYIGSKAVSVNTTSATISDDLSVGDDATITGDLDVDGTTNLDVVDIDGAVNMATTALVTGVLTTTAAAVFNGGFTSNGDTVTFTSANNADPLLILKNTTNDASGSRIQFIKDKGAAGADGDDISNLEFIADNDAQQLTTFAQIKTEISDASDGAEGGKMSLRIATHDGELQTGLLLQDGNAEDEVDVTIGKGAASVTTIAGDLSVTSQYLVPATSYFIGSAAQGFRFNNAADSHNNMIISDAGAVTIRNGLSLTDGNVAVANGHGIDFTAGAGGNSTSNLLDEYEEGTWTPAITGSSANPSSLVYGAQTGEYTKIGRQVTIHFRIQTTGGSGGSGTFAISGLPFTPSSIRSSAIISFSRRITNGGGPLAVHSYNGTASFNLYKYTDADDFDTAIEISDVTTFGSLALHGSLTYYAT